ncbi:MAG TPA: SgcJ/EcaC family oxidoreductase [Pyrinomonadaceae bacterium]
MVKRLLSVIVCSIFFLSSATLAQDASSRNADEKAIRAVIASLTDAWTAGDARAWARAFTEDADFTVWNGLYQKGREAIERGHAQIFSTFYKDTKLRYIVRSIRFLRDEVAVIHVDASVVKKGEDFPAAPQAVPVLIMVKDKGQWRVAVFHNTNVQLSATVPSSAAKLTAGTLPVSSGELYYELQGEGQPVILLHAGGMDSKMWDAQFNYLSQQFQVVRYDLRGFGRSSKTEQPFHPVDDLYQLMHHLGIKRASLIGLSMGSGVALNFALEHPEMVEKLALASMSGPPRNLPPQAQVAMPKGKPIFENGKPIPERLKVVSTPTLLLVGEKDTSSIEMAENVVRLIPAARKIVFASASHFLNSEQPEPFNRELTVFLKGN